MFQQKFTKHTSRGIGSIEVVIGVSIAALILVFVVHAVTRFVTVGLDIADRTQALYLAEEGLELVKFIRDGDWDTIDDLALNTPHSLLITGSSIATTSAPEVVDGVFTRSFEVTAVERNGNDDVVAAGTPDDQSKYVTVTVTWGSPVKNVSLTSMITDIRQP